MIIENSRRASFVLVLLIGWIAFIACPESAQATAKLKLDDGVNTPIIVVDGDANDINTETGIIGYYGALGVFDISLDVSGSLMGTSTDPWIRITSGVISSGKGSLDIWFSEVGFGPGNGYFETTVGGLTRGKSPSFSSYVDQTNTYFGTATSIGSVSSINGSDVSGTYALSNPYSMTSLATINHNRSSITSSSFTMDVMFVPDSVTHSPEPVSSILFVIGGAVMGFRVYTKRKKRIY